MRSLPETIGRFRRFAFGMVRAVVGGLPGGRIPAFGAGREKIGSILVVNLDRQPRRLRRTMRELSRFRTCDGASLASLAQRFAAVDARDGRAVAATADVDPTYPLGHQLHVQPSARLEECFGAGELIRMSRQEVAVARSHIEVWKEVARGPHDHVLILEDDVWFGRGAAAAVDRGWRAAWERCRAAGGPRLLYLSYSDADSSAERADECDALFRPLRGLWFLSGYVLSREGAAMLLRAMPVVGPVDMWLNFRFEDLGALALTSPAILQRVDGSSDNAHSILPYLARAGIVDAHLASLPDRARATPLMAWTACGERDGLAMALSMLGLRVRAFDGDEPAIRAAELPGLFDAFDALVDPPLANCTLAAALARSELGFVVEENAPACPRGAAGSLPPGRTAVLPPLALGVGVWEPICSLLGVEPPAQAFPVGPPRCWRMFRDDRNGTAIPVAGSARWQLPVDDSPWALLPGIGWPSPLLAERSVPAGGECLVQAPMTTATSLFPGRIETFPGNLAAFARDGLVHSEDGVRLVLAKDGTVDRPYRSGAFASARLHGHGRFEAEVMAARGPGLVTGFFLHRAFPRQEIDVEITGDNTRRLLANVYFNPGDDGAAMEYGYRGSPCRIDLGFDAASDFHRYAIEWRPGRIAWLVDGRIVHERVSWDPTPIPHLPMRLHGNLWAPRSSDLAGRLDNGSLPATAMFRNVSIWS